MLANIPADPLTMWLIMIVVAAPVTILFGYAIIKAGRDTYRARREPARPWPLRDD